MDPNGRTFPPLLCPRSPTVERFVQVSWYPYGISHAWEDDDDDDADDDDDDKDDDDDDEYSREKNQIIHVYL